MNITKGELLKVTWVDPQTNAGWIEEKGYLENVITIGFFIDEDDTTLWLAGTYHKGTMMYADEFIFPKGCVISMERID